MKKLLLITLLLLFISNLKAQNKFCTDVKKTYRCGTIVYQSPTPSFPGLFNDYKFSLLKIVSSTNTNVYLQIGPTTTNCDTPATDVSVTFKDKSKLNYSNVQFLNIIGDSSYVPTILLSNDDLQILKTRKVDFFTVGGITANPFLSNFDGKIAGYAACIEASDKTTPADFATCTAINKTFDDMKAITTYCSSLSELVRVEKTITPSDTTLVLMFCQTLHGFQDQSATVYVKFDDGTLSNFPSNTVYTKEQRNLYFYACRVTLTPDNLKLFKQKKVIKYQLYNNNALVDNALGNAVISWLNCMDNLK